MVTSDISVIKVRFERNFIMFAIVLCLVVIVEALILLNVKNPRYEILWFSIGGILVGAHLLALAGAQKTGTPPPPLTDLVGFIAYNIFFILGIISIVLGFRCMKARDEAIISEDDRISKEAQEKGMTPFEYIKSEVPQEVLESCEEVRGYENLLKTALKEYEKKGLISPAYAYIIWKEYMKTDEEEVEEDESQNE